MFLLFLLQKENPTFYYIEKEIRLVSKITVLYIHVVKKILFKKKNKEIAFTNQFNEMIMKYYLD